MCSLYRRENIIKHTSPNFPVMVRGGKGGMQESLHQFVGRFMSIVESLSGPSMTIQLVTSSPTIAGHTHTGFEI